jgi:hypothetical protein
MLFSYKTWWAGQYLRVMGVEIIRDVMYPNLSTRKFHIRSRTSLCPNIPPVHIMVAKHGLIKKGGSSAECGLSNLAYQWVLLRCSTAAGADSQTGPLSTYFHYPSFKFCSLSSGINLFFSWPILVFVSIINTICHGIYSKFILWQLPCVLALN